MCWTCPTLELEFAKMFSFLFLLPFFQECFFYKFNFRKPKTHMWTARSGSSNRELMICRHHHMLSVFECTSSKFIIRNSFLPAVNNILFRAPIQCETHTKYTKVDTQVVVARVVLHIKYVIRNKEQAAKIVQI